MRIVIAFVCASLLATSILCAQATPTTDKEIAALKEQLANTIKSGVDKDGEIDKLKAALTQTPEAINRAIAGRAKNLTTFQESASVVACHQAKGKAFVSTDSKGQLVYAGCIL